MQYCWLSLLGYQCCLLEYLGFESSWKTNSVCLYGATVEYKHTAIYHFEEWKIFRNWKLLSSNIYLPPPIQGMAIQGMVHIKESAMGIMFLLSLLMFSYIRKVTLLFIFRNKKELLDFFKITF